MQFSGTRNSFTATFSLSDLSNREFVQRLICASLIKLGTRRNEMKLILTHTERKYWDSYKVAGIQCALSKDGQLFMFLTEDVKDKLKLFPKQGMVYYLDETKDREIAEVRGDRVLVNPLFVWQNWIREK